MEYKFLGTPAPWRWEINKKGHQIQICGGVPKYDKLVMDFCRYGMGKGAPRFNIELRTEWNVMERADKFAEIVEGREHHAEWFQTINHADANLIAASPDLLQASINALELIERLYKVNELDYNDYVNHSEELKGAIHKALSIRTNQ